MIARESFNKRGRMCLFAGALLLAGVSGLSSCSEYDLDERDPEGWGTSIYSYMEDHGNYTNMVRIINDLGYRDVLGKTGSKTLFAANDEAFDRFYGSNNWGVGAYSDLTKAQKSMLLFGSMINNSFQLNYLSNTEGPVEGDCMRRLSALGVYDSVPVLRPEDMPANKYWNYYRTKGNMVCLTDMTVVPMFHFIEKFLTTNKITNSDYDFLYNNTTHRQAGEASVNGVQVAEEDIKCSNGFIHRMADVLTPLPNMAQIISGKPQVSQYNKMLERFCAPYYSQSATVDYNRIYGTNVDSVFQKRFFSEKSQDGEAVVETPSREKVPGRLLYDPGWNSYYAGDAKATTKEVALEKDMAMMLVPSNKALDEYWNSGAGLVLKERYGTWDNVPDDVLQELINNNMQSSLVGTVPSKFGSMLNDANDPFGITVADVDSVWLGCNGAIYLTNKVFSPTSYVSVLYPVIVNENMNIMRWGIKQQEYNIYLNSLNSYYSLFIPDNKSLLEYVDPVSYGKTTTQLFRFHYDADKVNENEQVWAAVYAYDAATGTVGDSVRKANYYEIKNRMKEILDNHIVIGDVEDGNTYYRTMGGSEIKVNNVAAGVGGMTVEGSYQVNHGTPIPINTIYNQSVDGNGKSYVLDRQPIMSTRKTVHTILSEHSEYAKFLELAEASGIFETIHNNQYACGGTNISTFNTYHYTVYVPANDAIARLQEQGKLPTVEQLEADEAAGDFAAKTADSLAINNFVKYHIQDNAVFIGAAAESGEYETSVIDPLTERFYRVKVVSDNSGITLTDNEGNKRHVVTSDKKLYNQMAKEYMYQGTDAENASQIETSSSAVVHLIDGALMYK